MAAPAVASATRAETKSFIAGTSDAPQHSTGTGEKSAKPTLAKLSTNFTPELHWSQMVFVLDNYDSFTFNLVQYMGELGAEVVVRRNDELMPEEVEALHPDRIVLSPGPCTPQEAGISIDLVRHMAGKVPILGVCLGHQAIGAAFGGNVVRAPKLMHGKTSPVEHDGRTIFAGLDSPMTCTRYHSLIVQEKGLPRDLEISARTADGTIMGLRHRSLPVEGVQFHPESVLTSDGKRLIENFLHLA